MSQTTWKIPGIKLCKFKLLVFHSNKSKKRSSYHYTLTKSWTVAWCKKKKGYARRIWKSLLLKSLQRGKRANITTTLKLRKEKLCTQIGMIKNQGKPNPEQSYKLNNWERHWVIKEFLKPSVETFGSIKLWSPLRKLTRCICCGRRSYRTCLGADTIVSQYFYPYDI